MIQHLGQGANQAFQDIDTLIALLDKHNPSTASPTRPAFKPTALSPEATVGIVIIIALVLVFTLAGIAVICGLRGERCNCRRRRQRRERKRETLVRFNVSDHDMPVKESREILLPPQVHTP